MEHIAYCGNINYKHIPETIVNEYTDDFRFDYKGMYHNVNDCIEDLYRANYNHIIIDITQFDNESDEVVSLLSNFKTTQSNTNIIVLAIGYSFKSEYIQNFMNVSFNYFVLSSTLGTQKSELLSGLKREVIRQSNKREPMAIKYTKDKKEKRTLRKIKIGVVGAMSRIGTTTQCLQAIKHLSSLGCRACYIQMNNSNFIETLLTVYDDTIHNEKLGLVKYSNIDMYYKPERLNEIYKSDYDFYIFDYGVYNELSIASFYEKDIHIAICGTMPNEMLLSTAMIDELKHLDMKYIFSFTHELWFKDILSLMENKESDTFFAGYCPDPFTLASDGNVWDKIIVTNEEIAVPNPKERKGLLRIFGGVKQ